MIEPPAAPVDSWGLRLFPKPLNPTSRTATSGLGRLIARGGVSSAVGEYAISAVPYLPVMNLVGQYLDNLPGHPK